MAITEDLLVSISVDTKNASAGVEKLELLFKDVASSVDAMRLATEKAEEAVTGIGATVVKTNAALELAKKGFQLVQEAIHAVKHPVDEAIAAYRAYLKEVTKLSNALKISGEYSDDTLESYKHLAEELEHSTVASEEQVLAMAALAKSIGITDEATEKAIKASIGLAAVTGSDLAASFDQVIGTLRGTARGVAVYDRRLKDLSEQELRSGKGLDLLAEKFEAFGTKQAKTYGGTLTQIHHLTEKVFRQIGEVFFTAFDLKGTALLKKHVLEEVLHFLESVKPVALSVAKSIQAFVGRVREAVISVNWIDLAKSVGILTAAFVAFKGVVLALEVASAIKAIGGLTAAIGAMGGATGILAQIVAFLKASSFLQAAKAVALMTGKFVLWGVAIAAIAASVDILVRNFSHLGDVFGLVASLFGGFLNRIGRGLHALGVMFLSTVESILESLPQALLDFGGVGAGALTAVRASLADFATDFDELDKMMDENSKEAAEYAKKVDFGIAGQGVAFFNRLLDDSSDKLGKAANEAGDLDKKLRGGGAARMGEDARKALEELIQKNADLQAEINKQNMLQRDAIEAKKDADLAAIERKREEFRISGKFNSAELAALDEQLAIQEALTEEKAAGEAARAPSREFEAPVKAGQEIANTLSQGLEGFAGTAAGFLTGTGAVLDAAQGLVDLIPSILSKATNIVNALTDLPNKIFEGVRDLSTALLRMVQQLIPNLITAVGGILDVVVAFVEQLPDRFAEMLDRLPEMLLRLVDRLPEIAERLVKALVVAGPEIAVAAVEFLLRDAPKIAIRLARVLAVELPKALVKGLVDALKEVGGLLSDLFKGKFPKLIDADELAGQIQDLGQTLTGEASKLFAVMDLEQAAAADTRAADLAKGIEDGMRRAGNVLLELWNKLVAALREAWLWIWNNVIKPLLDGILAVWKWVVENIILPIAGAIRTAFQWVIDNIIAPLAGVVSTAFQWIVDHVITPLTTIGQKIAEPLINAFNSLASFAGTVFGALRSLFTFDFDGFARQIGEAFKAAGQAAVDLIEAPLKSLVNVLNMVKFGPIEYEISAGKLGSWDGTLVPKIDPIPELRFQEGGPVERTGLAQVEVGEYVLRPAAVAGIGEGAAAEINRTGRMPGGGVTVNQTNNFNITTEQPIDDAFFRSKILPKVEESLRRKSLDGARVLSPKGVF